MQATKDQKWNALGKMLLQWTTNTATTRQDLMINSALVMKILVLQRKSAEEYAVINSLTNLLIKSVEINKKYFIKRQLRRKWLPIPSQGLMSNRWTAQISA